MSTLSVSFRKISSKLKSTAEDKHFINVGLATKISLDFHEKLVIDALPKA